MEPVHLMLVWIDNFKTPVSCVTQTWSDLSRQLQKSASKWKCTEREYNDQEYVDVTNKNVKTFCNTN